MSSDTAVTDTSSPPGIVSRRLKSFPAPDLEVVVGVGQRIYRYHACILASYSTYVDTMLASPFKEQETMHITFPDIEPEVWEKMIRFLAPGEHMVGGLADMAQVLPLYDKYQFVDGLRLCDTRIRDYLTRILARELIGYYRAYDELIPLVVMSFDLDLPLSKSKAVEFAAQELKRMSVWTKEEHIQDLLPLVENDDSTLLSLVKTVRGRHSRDMTLEEMRTMVKEEAFPRQCVSRSIQIQEQEEVLEHLHVKQFTVRDYETLRCGQFEKYCEDGENPGAMKFEYKAEQRSYGETNDNEFLVEAMDAFGLVWEFVMIQRIEGEVEGEENTGGILERRRVLYRWDSGFGSLIPPKSGWEAVDGELPVPILDYQISSNPYA